MKPKSKNKPAQLAAQDARYRRALMENNDVWTMIKDNHESKPKRKTKTETQLELKI